MTSELLMLRNSIESTNNQSRENLRTTEEAVNKIREEERFDNILHRMERLRTIARLKGSANARSKRLQTSFCF